MKVAPTWTLAPVDCWAVRLDDGTEGIVQLDDQWRPVGVQLVGGDRLTSQIAKRLTSRRVLNAIRASAP